MISIIQRKRRLSDESEEVVKEVQERLERSAYPPLRRVSVEYERGVLILRGRLPNYFHKQLVQEAVRGIDGVIRVVNETEVSLPHPRCPHTMARRCASAG